MRFYIALLFVMPFIAMAQETPSSASALKTDGIYTMDNIDVEAQGKTALEARQLAFASGQKSALQRLMMKLTTSENAPDLANLSDQRISEMVSGVQVMPDTEKIYEGHYRAKLIVYFKPEPVRALISQVKNQLTETPPKTLLLVPLYQKGSDVYLWEDTNPWKQIWSNPDLKNSMHNLVLPLGDLSDIQTLSKEDIAQQKLFALQSLATKYSTQGIIVIQAMASDSENRNLVINLSSYDFTNRVDVKKVTIPNTKGGDLETLFPEAAKKVLNSIREGWKEKGMVDLQEKNFIKLVIPLRDLQEWVRLQDVLKSTPNVIQFEPQSLSPMEAVIKLWFYGTVKQLNVGLTARNVEAVQSYDGYMLLPYKTN